MALILELSFFLQFFAFLVTNLAHVFLGFLLRWIAVPTSSANEKTASSSRARPERTPQKWHSVQADQPHFTSSGCELLSHQPGHDAILTYAATPSTSP